MEKDFDHWNEIKKATDAANEAARLGVRKTFPKPDGGELVVLDDVNLRVAEDEIIGLLGRSGSGKSTLPKLVFARLVEKANTATARLAFLNELVEAIPLQNRCRADR